MAGGLGPNWSVGACRQYRIPHWQRVVRQVFILSIGHCDHGFESHLGRGNMSAFFFCVCCNM
jgi:hypothetical protein